MKTRLYTTDLTIISRQAKGREKENEAFHIFLLSTHAVETDTRVHHLNAAVEAAVDCTECGNCCRSLMINVTPAEVDTLATMMKKSSIEIREKYIEESLQGSLVMNTIPCAFLAENKCSIYQNRFTECRDFPHLYKPGFTRRFTGTILHYATCPIVYNVIELLKREMKFETAEFR